MEPDNERRDYPPQDRYTDEFREWRKVVRDQRLDDYEWLEGHREEIEATIIAGRVTETDYRIQKRRADVKWYMDLVRWQRDLIRWEREDLEWERKLQSREQEAERGTNPGRATQKSDGKRKRNRQHRKRRQKPANRSVS